MERASEFSPILYSIATSEASKRAIYWQNQTAILTKTAA